MRIITGLGLAASLLVALAGCRSAGDVRSAAPPAQSIVTEITDLARVPEVLAEAQGRSTLLVLDIDDTLLTSTTFFGSDSWYEWQKTLAPGAAGLVPCRFDVIALNYEAGTQRRTQDDAPAQVEVAGVDRLMLTARNPLYRGGTIRELQANGYALPAPLGPNDDGVIYGFRKSADATPVTVSYDDGVMMVSGQDKGLTLLSLLARLERSYELVVLVDDGRRNIDNMQAALRDEGIDYHGLWYTRIDKSVSAQDVVDGIAGWEAWRSLLATNYPERLVRMEAGDCAY